MYLFTFLMLCCLIYQRFAVQIQSLGTYLWNVKNANKTIYVQNIGVPGGIYTDLQKTGILNESVYYRFNDVNYRWIAYDNWTYSVSFPAGISADKIQELVFHGLDGHADILLNDHFIGYVNNTFIRYRFDVSNYLQDTNFLEVRFMSPITSGYHLASVSKHSVPPSCVPPDYHGECHVNFLRRMAASYGWDWGLAVPSVGIWKQAELIAYQDDLLIRDMTVSTILDGEQWTVVVNVFSEGPRRTVANISGDIDLILFVENNEKFCTTTQVSLNTNSNEGEVVATATMNIPKNKIRLWWPTGYGFQSLYTLSATFRNKFGGTFSKDLKIGFRKVQLIQEPVNATNPKQGLTFYFSINDVPIFAKGSNYIPSSIFLEESGNRTILTNLLTAAKEANMNILRIWGGGIYADDFFYEECDRLGILVWQDMMFACSMYPADEQYLSSVKIEIGQQIRRLQHHASIIVWAGNNENEAALSGNWYGTTPHYDVFKQEYIKLYVNTIKGIVSKFDNTRSYLVSSPTNGVSTEAEGYVSRNPYSPLFGDLHFYDYLHDAWIADHYPMTRFSSEYGFQSLPSLFSLHKVTTTDDLKTMNTKFLLHRQHQPLGYIYLLYQILLHFSAPKLDDVENVIYLSQINQALSVKSQSEWYRIWRSQMLPNGEGRTMGAMYWQLNDVWQAPSWSSIEFGNKWKMLHYYTKKFFAPVIITGQLWGNGKIVIYIVSDLRYDLPNVKAKLQIYKWDSMTPVQETNRIVKVEKEHSVEFFTSSVTNLIESNLACRPPDGSQKTRCFVKMSLLDKDRNDELIHENFLYLSSFKAIFGLQNSRIFIKVESCPTAKICIMNVVAEVISLFVWLEVGDIPGHFSDNGFTMTESEKQIRFYSEKYITKAILEQSINITVLDKARMDSFSGRNDSKTHVTALLSSNIIHL